MNNPEKHGNGCNVLEKFQDPSDQYTDQIKSVQSIYDEAKNASKKSSLSPHQRGQNRINDHGPGDGKG